MRIAWVVVVSIIAAVASVPWQAGAFECPKHFQEAQNAIDRVAAEMQGAYGVSKHDMALVHALLDDAKMALSGARHNHEKPQGAYDHARAIAKADAAHGHAKAAGLLFEHYKKR